MNLFQKIQIIYPEITISDVSPLTGTIVIQDDSDGLGPYIAEWNYPLPQPTQEQLDGIKD